ncbi:MAG: hypothetical protein WCP64_05345 [Actinomycetes bacterium]
MRKIAAIVVALTLTSAMSYANAASPVLGGKCGPVGNQYGSGAKKMICALKNKKLVWIKSPTTSSPNPPQNQQQGIINPYADLPSITTFQKNLTSVFPVDFSKAVITIPFLGANSKAPHSGLHVHWSNADGIWTNTGGKENVTGYPVVRAFEDGVVDLVTPLFTMQTGNGDGHQKYGVVLAFARALDGKPMLADYSLEPLVMEPAPHFYEAFIKVKQGQKVKKGDILAYMYVPPSSSGGTHVHFNLISNNIQISPSVFTPEVVKSFAAKYLETSWLKSGATLPVSIGYGLTAAQNPFANKAVDSL